MRADQAYCTLMSDITRMASVAALLGDPARANILVALLDGRALTAKELAFAAHVSPSTTSGHLGRLTDAELLAVLAKQVCRAVAAVNLSHACLRIDDPN